MMSVTTAWTWIRIRRSGTSSTMRSGMWSAICISCIMARSLASWFGTFGNLNFNSGAMKFFILQLLNGCLDTFFFGIFDKSKASWNFARAEFLYYYTLCFLAPYILWHIQFGHISRRSLSGRHRWLSWTSWKHERITFLYVDNVEVVW